ncbi:MAG: hypothetical protein QM723_11090 [Myxococcaceae bacterium]
MNPNPGAPPPGGPGGPAGQKKSSTSKVVLIILAVLGGLALICCIVSAVFANQAMKDPNVRKGFAAAGKGLKMAEKGMSAPGTAELRKAGCSQAMVIDMADAMEIIDMFADGGETKKMPDELTSMVICQGNMFDNLPTDCGVLAKTYVEAAHPTHGFALQVQKQGEQKPICQNTYEADGSLKTEGFGKKH